jgi:hypothetical protein
MKYLICLIFISSTLHAEEAPATLKATAFSGDPGQPVQELVDFGGFPEMDYEHVGQETGMMKSSDTWVRRFAKALPDSGLKHGLNRYMEIVIGKSILLDGAAAGSNGGIAEFNTNQIRENPCFAKLTEAFYADINKQDEEIFPKDVDWSVAKKWRSTLEDSPEYSELPKLKPGWLFEKALKYSAGDPNLAMKLISICGHDDKEQGVLSYASTNPVSLDDTNRRKYLAAIDYRMHSFELILKKGLGTPVIEKYVSDIKAYKEKLLKGDVTINQSRSVKCPISHSTFYQSKALDPSVDLPEEYKDRIAAIQAPTKGREVIPSKNYHFMAAASMACELVEKGVSPKMASVIQKMAAWGYRTVRMNSILKNDLNYIHEIEEIYEKEIEDKKFQREKSTRTARRTKIKKTSVLSFDEWLLRIKNPFKQDDYRYWSIPVFSNLEDVKKWKVKYDAAKVLDHLTVGGKVAGLSLPHTNISLSFSGDPVVKHLSYESRKDKSSHRIKRKNNPMNWEKKRFDEAKLKAMTYLVDWDWTVKQHEIGASFGANNCKKRPIEVKPDDSACAALDNRPGVVCQMGFKSDSPQTATVGTQYEGFGKEVSKLTLELEAATLELKKELLDPEIKVEETQDGQKISGLY